MKEFIDAVLESGAKLAIAVDEQSDKHALQLAKDLASFSEKCGCKPARVQKSGRTLFVTVNNDLIAEFSAAMRGVTSPLCR